jgi:hypothetical protein
MVRRVSIGGVGGGGLWLVVLLTSEVVMGDGCRYAVCDEECA